MKSQQVNERRVHILILITLMQEPSPEMVKGWKETYDTYRTRLKPNNKPAEEVISYLKQQYPVTQLTEPSIQKIVTDNVTMNEYYAKKLPAGKSPVSQVFTVENTGAGKNLYENQDDQFKGTDIIVGFDSESGYFMVEGSSLLRDELFVFRGLDEDDLNNFYLVSEYVECLKKSGSLDIVLTS